MNERQRLTQMDGGYTKGKRKAGAKNTRYGIEIKKYRIIRVGEETRRGLKRNGK